MSEPEPSAPPPPPPPQQRRPRVREVSSRFMTPSASHSHSSSPLPNQRQRSSSVQRPASSASTYPDENRNLSNRSSPNPPRVVAKLVFKESSNRPDTPTAASKLLHSSGISPSVSDEMNAIATRMTPGVVVSSRYLGGLDSPCSRSLDLLRSSSDSSTLFNSLKVSERERERRTNPMKLSGSGLPLHPPPSQTKLAASSCSFDGAKKAKKVSGHQEDVHSLKLLYNRYLQWRFVNAKAETSAKSQRRGAERALYAHGMKISELYESVARMRIQFLQLRKLKILFNILDTQMPYLDQWSTIEEDYATSLSQAIQALLNASVQIPISGNVRADVTEMQDALNSAMKFLDSIALNLNNFMLQAEQNDVLLSELARLTGGERALIEECGYLLTGVHKSQVEECSLKSQLVQLHRGGTQESV